MSGGDGDAAINVEEHISEGGINAKRVVPYGDSGAGLVKFSLDADGNLKITVPGVVDDGNSSTALLGISEVFEGVGKDVLNYASVAVTITSDEDSAADGMKFQFSTDNSNWDDSNDFELDVSESGTRRFQFPVTAQYFRVQYTNGATAQGVFRLQTILHETSILQSIHKVEDTIVGNRSVQLMKAVIAGETTAGGGAFVNAKMDPAGKLETNVSQDTHDDLNCNANVQVGNTDVSASNPVPTTHGKTLLRAKIDVNSSGDNSIVAAASGLKTKVVLVKLTHNAAVSSKWRSGTTDLEGAALWGESGGYALPSPDINAPMLETAVNTALNLNLSAAIQSSGFILYYQEA